ncbi:3-dehydroquinate synthase [Pseudogracilibacillus sp. SE30717A]|uniref:3-dehydroquinate synthase n=1 Tax=Pseudogracilibacillus sp. SE30717A TaxID=3098293 RepID=UPI00300DFE8A
MNELNVQTSTHSYPVYIGENLRFKIKELIKKDYSSILIITDDHVASLYLEEITDNLNSMNVFSTIIPSGEASKNIDSFYHLQTIAIENGLDRNSLILALGGGVVGDLAGFVAATFMRGIDYIQIPTTILAHDSSVGGKVAINHEKGKNLIGNFYPPRAVIYDVNTLSTLPEHEIRSGYAELIKEAYISDEQFLHELLTIDLKKITSDQLMRFLYLGIKIKATIVEQDEKESSIRKFLNFGHTLAHALETKLGYGKITHGEAVAIGMLFSIRVSEQKYRATLPYKELYNWLRKNNYPLTFDDVSNEDIIDVMRLDKKAEKQQIQMVLLKNVAEPEAVQLTDQEIQTALESFKKELNAT